MTEEAIEMSSQTFDKNLDSNAITLLMNMAQKDQYSFPQKSAVREISSNAVDALNEREVAKSILSGQSKVEDHFLPRTDGIYKDSVFDHSYYELGWLSNKKEVHIIYSNNGTVERDELTIRDFGVGLWGRRLRGYFNLGYSTKRNSRFALGKFGIGAKSALSTGVPFYTMRTRYNGKTTAFNVYLQKVEPITPKFNLETGRENESFDMEISEGNFMKVYYEPTLEENGVDITLQVKKHHKNQYIDAVRSQLMYFSEVRFFEETHGRRTEMDVKAEILYEDDVMVISENTFHNRPHMLIDRVNYGNIEFTELELEEKKGNVGIKVSSDNVSVNPSRERVIWDDHTKQTILDAFNRVVANAGKRLEEQLKTDNFLEWLRSAYNLQYSYKGNDPVIHAMAAIADFSKLKLGFSKNPELYSNSHLFQAISLTSVSSISTQKGNRKVYALNRGPGTDDFRSGKLPIVVRHMGTESNARKNKYLSRVVYPEGYVDLVLPRLIKEEEAERGLEGWVKAGLKYMPSGNFSPLPNLRDYFIDKQMPKKYRFEYEFRDKEPEKYRELRDEAFQKVSSLFNFLCEELLAIEEVLVYETVEVPSNFKVSEKDEEEDEEFIIAPSTDPDRVDYAARRKAEGKILIHTPSTAGAGERTVTDVYEDGTPYERSISARYKMLKLELSPAVVDTWNREEIYYCNKDDEEMLHYVTSLLPQAGINAPMETEEIFPTDDLTKFKMLYAGVGFSNCNAWEINTAPILRHKHFMAFMVSKEHCKHFADYKHIRQFFMDMDKNVLTMSNLLVKYNTARIISEHWDKLRFCRNFAPLNPEIADMFAELEQYQNAHFRSFTPGKYGDRMHESVVDYLQRVTSFQLFVRENKHDPESVALMATQLLAPEEGTVVEDAKAVDIRIYDMLMKLLDMAEPVYTMLNEVAVLTRYKGDPVSAELEYEIRLYIQHKNADILLTYKRDQ